jgi:ArsR family transcriptional regulator, arsenate/arsenite/antimonite-responsive transcriptional repressor
MKPLGVARKSKTDTPEVARLFHALSDETRLAILARLRNGEQCVCNLVDLLGAGQSRLSFHLKTLKDAGLVLDRPAGRWVYYSINSEALETIGEFIASFGKGRSPSEVSACCKK